MNSATQQKPKLASKNQNTFYNQMLLLRKHNVGNGKIRRPKQVLKVEINQRKYSKSEEHAKHL